MKRMIKADQTFDDMYLVHEIPDVKIPGMIAFRIIDNLRNQSPENLSDAYYVEPKRAILCLGEADAYNLFDELSEHYRQSVNLNNIADVISADGCSGVIADVDGTLVLIENRFHQYTA